MRCWNIYCLSVFYFKICRFSISRLLSLLKAMVSTHKRQKYFHI
jgi:hypothetical protein